MFDTVRNAFKIKDIRGKIIFTFIALLIVRLGSQLPLYKISETAADVFGSNDSLKFFDTLTGGSLSSLSIFALNISPYITASIIMQLLTIAIPSLEEMQKDGETGRKKIATYTRYLTIVLAIIEGTAMAFGFSSGTDPKLLLTSATDYIIVISALVAGSAFLMWLGEKINDKGIGNGISIILAINILAKVPEDIARLVVNYVITPPDMVKKIVAIVLIAGILVALVVLINILNGGQRKIPVQYAKKVQGRKMVGGQSSHIPLKVNTAGVIPVIFASSIMSFPGLIAGFFNVQAASGVDASIGQKILKLLITGSWFNVKSLSEFKYSLGLILYLVLLVFFAYFYTTITFNPTEIANNMKKNGGFVPGIRPGKPTSDFLNKVLNNIVFIGAVGLAIVCVIPIIAQGITGAQVSFGGTSLIIIVGVVLETIKQIESQMLVRHYKGFLND